MALLVAAAMTLSACGDDDDDTVALPDAGRDAAPDAATDAAPDGPPVCEPSELSLRSPEMFDAIVAHLVEHETHDQGNWDLDFGDATAYAPPVLTAVGRARCDPALEAERVGARALPQLRPGAVGRGPHRRARAHRDQRAHR